jgi:septum formation protein
VRPADVEELERGDPPHVVAENARRKACAIAEAQPSGIPVLGVDTVVALEQRMLGKPADADQARSFLAELSGRTHHVFSGVCVWRDGAVTAAVADTAVTFRRLAEAELDWYLRRGEWQGRAGGYAIQEAGAVLVSRIEGDYLNVVGLPFATLLSLLPDLHLNDESHDLQGI